MDNWLIVFMAICFVFMVYLKYNYFKMANKVEKLEDERKEVFDLAHTIALANIDDRLIDPINRIAELSKSIGG